NPRAFLRALYDAAVARALPGEVIGRFLPAPPKGRTLVLGAGKAGGAMAAAVDALWPKDAPLSGLVVTRYDYVPPGYKARPGRLAALCAPAKVVTLTISDVPGDDPAVIASGPTVPDATTCADALRILQRYGIEVPAAARAGLESGTFETPKPGDAVFAGHEVQLIATPQESLEAAAAFARDAGIDAHILSDEIEGESRDVGKVHAALARAVARRGQPFTKPCVILSGGETTVTVRSEER